MIRASFTWTIDSDRKLVELVDEGLSAVRIATLLTAAGTVATPGAVRRRCAMLGLRLARNGVWTRALDARLCALWRAEPRMKLQAIRDALAAGIDCQAVSRRAAVLGLPPRYGAAAARGPAPRPSRAGEFVAPLIEAKRREVRPRQPALETPCPFIEANGERCNAIVDRRPGANGVRPSQYCPLHRPRVLPIGRGSIGTLATYGRGVRFV